MRQEAQRGRVLKSSWLLAKIATYLVSFGPLLCLAFLYGWHFLNKIPLDWPGTLTTQPSTSKLSDNQGLSQAAPLRQSRTVIGIVPLKNGQGDNLSPSKFSEKTRKEAHTKRFISVQKLQAETERGKYILSHV